MSEQFDIWMLLAGLGVFLFGMRQLELSLEAIAGRGFRRFLRQTTSKPVGSIFGGIFATTIVQSSSLVGLIVLAFVGAGIIPLVNAIGIVLGSNLGTTFTGWVVTTLGFKMNLAKAIFPMLALGGLGYGLFKDKLQAYSQFLLGLALLLMGLDFMKDSASVLQNYFDIEVLKGYPTIVFLLVGVVFTAIIQSSSATMMLTLSALYAGIIPLPAAAALVIGADLGTTSTVLLGSMQGAVAKRQLAMAHLIFNVLVDVLAFLALYPLLDLIRWIEVSDPLYSLVLFHSLFNLLGIIIFLPFLNQYAQFLERWIKDDKTNLLRYIQSVPLTVSDAAIEALARETHHLLYLVSTLNIRFLRIYPDDISIENQAYPVPEVLLDKGRLKHYETIKELEGKLISYALRIDTPALSKVDAKRLDTMLDVIRSGIYSAKALKDIDDDFQLFDKLDIPVIASFSEKLHKKSVSHYQKILLLLNGEHARDYILEELTTLKEKSQDFHNQLEDDIYKETHKAKLSAFNLSTLLNVNKEVQTSEKAILVAMEHRVL